MCVFLFFFFKQKTAYEMRISDWSSDVCSSDLRGRQQGGEPPGGGPGGREGRAAERLGGGRTIGVHVRAPRDGPDGRSSSCAQDRARRFPAMHGLPAKVFQLFKQVAAIARPRLRAGRGLRWETSEGRRVGEGGGHECE